MQRSTTYNDTDPFFSHTLQQESDQSHARKLNTFNTLILSSNGSDVSCDAYEQLSQTAQEDMPFESQISTQGSPVKSENIPKELPTFLEYPTR